MYYILYYLKNEGGCQKKDGFVSRQKAWDWLKDQLDQIDWYQINEA